MAAPQTAVFPVIVLSEIVADELEPQYIPPPLPLLVPTEFASIRLFDMVGEDEEQ
jgi:hypothetical protein